MNNRFPLMKKGYQQILLVGGLRAFITLHLNQMPIGDTYEHRNVNQHQNQSRAPSCGYGRCPKTAGASSIGLELPHGM
jgi:hypothetical protein